MSAVNAAVSPAQTVIPQRARRALVLAGALGLLLVGVYLAAFHVVAIAQADAHAYFAFLAMSQQHPQLGALAQRIVGLCQPDPYVFLAAAAVGIALLRRRWTLAIALVVMIPGAVLTSELLKPLLAAPRPALGVGSTALGEGSWPSGHSTAAMALAMAFLLASPARWRPWVAAAGSLFALAVIYSLLCLGWHYPSDALGGVLVASIWSLVAVAAVWTADAHLGRDLSALSPERARWLARLPGVDGVESGSALDLPLLLAIGVAGALPALAVLFARGHEPAAYAAEHTAFVAAVLAIGVIVALAPTSLSLMLSGSDRAARAARPVRSRRG